ncbi:MAG: LacI family DNA-binding transcriptional regulator [Pseudomonadota bacterium]
MAPGPSRKKSTIFDVAALAGVSIKTVSRVVNREAGVHEKTQAKVEDAIARLSYRPNIAARGLSGRRSYVVGLVYENPHEFSYMKDVLNGALRACEREGYTLLLRPVTLPDRALAENIRQFSIQTSMDGIILPAPLGDIDEVQMLLKELALPSALIAAKTRGEGSLNVLGNDEEASYMVTRYVFEQGHSRIGFIKGHPDHGATEKRLRGYRRCLKDHGLVYDRSLVKPGHFDFESGRDAARKLLSMSERPTAIIASNDDMAAGVLFEAHERALQVPGDLTVIGFDDTPVASHVWPPLTTVRQPIIEMAEAATQMLIRQLRGESVVVPDAPFDCELIVRQSSGPPR